MATLLETRNVRKIFTSGGGLFKSKKVTVALDDFSLAIDDDTPIFTTIAGESGSGKTTLSNLLLGFLAPTSGEVLYRGKPLTGMSAEARRQFHKEVQAIFQDPYEVYNPFYTIDHILTTPVQKFNLAGSKAEAHELIVNALRNVGLNPRETLGRYPHQLSGGQRQRVTIARALIVRPRLIIADEPVSMVDASLRASILENLRSLYRDFRISFLYITHDLTTAYQMSKNIVVLYQGTVAEAGDVTQVIKTPQHPYTQELVASIPLPDPDRRWGPGGTATIETKNGRETSRRGSPLSTGAKMGCRYADRCPFVMAKCHEVPPPLYRTGPHRAVACYLFEEAPVLPKDKLGEVLPAPFEGAESMERR